MLSFTIFIFILISILNIIFCASNTSQVVCGKIYVFLGDDHYLLFGPFHGFQAQIIIPMFIQTGAYVKSTIHLKSFLVSQPE